MVQKRRICAALTACAVILAVIVSVLCIAVESDHECTGDDCGICRMLALCENTVKVLTVALCACISAVLVKELFISGKSFKRISSFRISPIILGVKLLS